MLHVLRCFDDGNVVHVAGAVDPLADRETVETELMLADLQSMERRVPALEKLIRGGQKDAKVQLELVQQATAVLAEGRPARTLAVPEERQRLFRELQLLTAKPVLYVCNVDEGSAATGNALSRRVEEAAAAEGAGAVVVAAAIEAEVSQLGDPDEKRAFLEDLGLAEPGLDRLIRAGYDLLGLITYFTAGPKEARAWTIPRGTKAAQAAGRIHTDFERGFIAAETIGFEDYVAAGGEAPAKEQGRMRLEGRDYVVQDGDVILFRFNV